MGEGWIQTQRAEKGKVGSLIISSLHLMLMAIFMQTIYFGRHCERIAIAADCMLQCASRGKLLFANESPDSGIKLA